MPATLVHQVDEKMIHDLDPRRPNGRGKCPFCGGEYAAGYKRNSVSAEAPRGRAMIFHSVPTCDKFDLTAGPDFLTLAREAGAKLVPIWTGDEN